MQYGDWEVASKCYQDIGRLYKYMGKGNKAIKAFKKQLTLSWYINNPNIELDAYQNLSTQYTDIERQSYLHNLSLIHI